MFLRKGGTVLIIFVLFLGQLGIAARMVHDLGHWVLSPMTTYAHGFPSPDGDESLFCVMCWCLWPFHYTICWYWGTPSNRDCFWHRRVICSNVE